MHKAEVEIYSDETNRAVLRHPGRRFPGVLIQGDSLYQLCAATDELCKKSQGADAYQELNSLRNALWDYLNHYKKVLGEHDIPLPFSQSQ